MSVWGIDTPLLYSYGFDKYDTAARTGLNGELIKAGKLFRDYFNNDKNYSGESSTKWSFKELI
ncbi:MAG: hypothetical protein CM1200mP8_0340 [Chloroflexota bacterium]|nr:MAG: hypothetical protein CM1200mP8_0340 [Chloroflexota bacterium]